MPIRFYNASNAACSTRLVRISWGMETTMPRSSGGSTYGSAFVRSRSTTASRRPTRRATSTWAARICFASRSRVAANGDLAQLRLDNAALAGTAALAAAVYEMAKFARSNQWRKR